MQLMQLVELIKMLYKLSPVQIYNTFAVLSANVYNNAGNEN